MSNKVKRVNRNECWDGENPKYPPITLAISHGLWYNSNSKKGACAVWESM